MNVLNYGILISTCVNTALATQKIKPMLDKAREDQPFSSEEIRQSAGTGDSKPDTKR